MDDVRIVSVASYLPRARVSNANLPPLEPPLSLEKIDSFGILARHHAGPDETVLMMGVDAAHRALQQARLHAEDLDFVLLANWTERRFVPDVAPKLAAQLGASRAFALDLCGACTGFLYGVATARAYLRDPRLRRGLVVASDRASRQMRPGSRATIVFGDAAAAAVIERGATRGYRIVDTELRSDGTRGEIMEIDADGYLLPHIRQVELNALAGQSMADVTRALLKRNELRLADVDRIVPHSGTAGVQSQLVEALGVDPRRVLTNLPEIGNVTTASIPCALRHFMDRGQLSPEHTVLTLSVGLGWHACGVLLSP